MKRYFAYIDTSPSLFKYAPEDSTAGAVDYPINSVIATTASQDEHISVVAIVWKGIADETIINFKSELFGIHQDTELRIIKVKELWPKYLMLLTDRMITGDFIQNGDIMYWDATNTTVAQCIHTLFVYGCEFFDEIYCEKVVMVIGDTIFNITATTNVEEAIRMLKKDKNISVDKAKEIIHQILTMPIK